MADTVTMSLKSYNELKEMNSQLLQENVALDKALKEAQESFQEYLDDEINS